MSLQSCMNMTINHNTINSNNTNTEPSLLLELPIHKHVFVYKLKEVIQIFFGKRFNVNLSYSCCVQLGSDCSHASGWKRAIKV